MPCFEASMVRPMALANSPLPSESIVTLLSAPPCLPQAPITKASLTAVQAISSTPLILRSSALSTKPGRWRAEQVGVNAPGTENRATLRPLKYSSESRSEEHTSELQSLMRISYAVFCLKKKNKKVYRETPERSK